MLRIAIINTLIIEAYSSNPPIHNTIQFQQCQQTAINNTDSFQNITWGRKRSSVNGFIKDRQNKETHVTDQAKIINQTVEFCGIYCEITCN